MRAFRRSFLWAPRRQPRRTGDDATILELWPAIEAALAWIDGPGDADGDGFVEYYRAKGEDVDVDIVTYGPGLHMLRVDTSPVQDRIKHLKDLAFPGKIQFSACNNTKEGMEKKEGHAIAILPEASVVPSGVVRLMQLQEQGWSYIRP